MLCLHTYICNAMKARRGFWILWNWSYDMVVVSQHVDANNWIQILWKNSQC